MAPVSSGSSPRAVKRCRDNPGDSRTPGERPAANRLGVAPTLPRKGFEPPSAATYSTLPGGPRCTPGQLADVTTGMLVSPSGSPLRRCRSPEPREGRSRMAGSPQTCRVEALWILASAGPPKDPNCSRQRVWRYWSRYCTGQVEPARTKPPLQTAARFRKGRLRESATGPAPLVVSGRLRQQRQKACSRSLPAPRQ